MSTSSLRGAISAMPIWALKRASSTSHQPIRNNMCLLIMLRTLKIPCPPPASCWFPSGTSTTNLLAKAGAPLASCKRTILMDVTPRNIYAIPSESTKPCTQSAKITEPVRWLRNTLGTWPKLLMKDNSQSQCVMKGTTRSHTKQR